ncbi:MAG: cbb3-type cytochrome oxidase assembly protein CcoS [Pseudomonadota bacterium]
MSILFLLIPLSLLLFLLALAGFFWMVRNGQFDDLETPGWQILRDDPDPETKSGNHD